MLFDVLVCWRCWCFLVVTFRFQTQAYFGVTVFSLVCVLKVQLHVYFSRLVFYLIASEDLKILINRLTPAGKGKTKSA